MNIETHDAESEPHTLGDYLAVLRRRRGLLLGVSAALLAATLAVAFGLPSVYRSTATILIEQQEIPQELVRSTVTSYADQRIQLISQSVMTTANLLDIVRKYELYVAQRENTPIESVLEDMREDIHVEIVSADVVDPRSGKTTKATIAFTIAYDNESPLLAQRVANELSSLYLNENLKSRTQAAVTTSSFLTGESEKLNARVHELQKRLAEFKQGNVENLPELTPLNLQLIDRTEREALDVEQLLRAAEQNAFFLEGQLASIEPVVEKMSPMVNAAGQRVLPPEEQLKLLQSQYASLAAVYSPDHPDVVRARKEIAGLAALVGSTAGNNALQSQLAQAQSELGTARERYSAEHPDVKRLMRTVAQLDAEIRAQPTQAAASIEAASNNPAYVQTKARLEAARTDLKTLRERRDGLRAKLADLEQRITAAPQIEREYRDLTREYESAIRDYEEVRAKRTEAQLGETMETERKAERFVLIEPPLLPESPEKPNRLAITALGVVLSAGVGLGSAAIAEALDTSVRGVRAVIALLGMPPLASIPFIESPADRRRKWLKRVLLIGLLVLAIGVLALVLHVFVMPLDVAWYTLLNRLGM